MGGQLGGRGDRRVEGGICLVRLGCRWEERFVCWKGREIGVMCDGRMGKRIKREGKVDGGMRRKGRVDMDM